MVSYKTDAKGGSEVAYFNVAGAIEDSINSLCRQ